MFNTPELRRKVFLICHGTPELTQKDYSTDFRYGVTSEAILPVLAEKTNIRNPHVMPNGVDFSLYTHVERSGVLNVIGWAGAWQIPCKRCHMLQPIVNGTWMGVKATTSNPGLPEDKMDEWYRGIDILLVMSGPERWAETGPLTAFEAVACGAIVVGTNVGNSGRIPGPKFETVDEAIAIINDLKQHPEKVRDLTKEQYAYVKENFSYDVLAPMWEKALFGDDKFNGDA
jgi:glycosyltransferase involved in cell wall biosynthesis